MKQALFSFFIVLLLLIFADAVWLGLMQKRFYDPQMAHLLSDSMKFIPEALLYIVYAVVLNTFVIVPGLKNNSSYLYLLLFGMLFGLGDYGSYNLTNQATLKNWSWTLTTVDMAWGVCLTGAISVIATYITRHSKKIIG